MNTTDLKSYQRLLHPSTKLWIQAHGETGTFALACEGPEDQIRLFHNLFSNFDPRERDDWGEFPAAPRLKRQNGLAYINITKARLRDSLLGYFRGNIALYDIRGEAVYNEEKNDIVVTYDEAAIEGLAQEATDRFIQHEIKTRTFLLPPSKGDYDTFAVSAYGSLVGAN
jgi:hypothetical protein